MQTLPKVLVVATSRKTRGGITAVVKAHETGSQWKKYHCRWIETHRDGNSVRKILYFIKGFFSFLFFLPSYNVVHVHMAAVLRKLPFIFIAKLFHKKLIVHLHVPDPNTTILSRKKNLYGYCFKCADIVIALSSQWKQLLTQTYNINNVRVLYNPCPRVHRQYRMDSKIILFAGTISERKGYHDLLLAFSKIAHLHKDWSIVLLGNGEIHEGKEIARKLGMADQIYFKGWIDGSEKEKEFQEAAIFCLPSYAEGFPMSVLDAWAYGIPVICTPVGGLPDVIQEGKNSLIFNPGDVDKLAEQLLYIIDNDVVRFKLHRASCELSDNVFNVDVINKQLDDIYRSLLCA